MRRVFHKLQKRQQSFAFRFSNAIFIRYGMNHRDASIRGIGDFASGEELTQLDRGRTERSARSIFAMQSIAV